MFNENQNENENENDAGGGVDDAASAKAGAAHTSRHKYGEHKRDFTYLSVQPNLIYACAHSNIV
jgi:hypothetical protein